MTTFRVGDKVFYAGSIARAGTNSELHLVDERIVAIKPRTLDWGEAAALVIGGAGGVGSMTIQLARQLTFMTIIATASRPETRDWSHNLGAHHVVDHSRPLAPQIATLRLGAPAFVLSTTHSDRHQADVAALIAPQGRLALIDDPV